MLYVASQLANSHGYAKKQDDHSLFIAFFVRTIIRHVAFYPWV